MKKSDLTKLIIESNEKMFAVVGPNTSGKSYYLTNDLYNNLPDGTLMVDEDGRFQVKGNKNKVKISSEYYIYDNELKRGTENVNIEMEKITFESLNVISAVKKMIGKVNTLNKSLGSSKLYNILNSIMSYNINHIEYVLFDEPENSLDDEGIKCIEKLFNILIQNGKKIFFITHSPRLLELLQIDIDYIYLFPKIYSDVVNFKKDYIYDLFDKNGEELIKLKPKKTCNQHEKFDFLPNTGLRNMYINDLLKSDDFYRVLFYSHVVIVEGRTEELIARKLSDDLPASKCIFNAGGKYKIPFLISLFELFCEKITCIIDSDEPEDGVTTLSSELTFVIENKRISNKCNVYSLPRDLESFLNYDKNNIVEILSSNIFSITPTFVGKFGKYYKPYLPLYVIENNEEARNKIRELFIDKKDTYMF